MARLGRLSPNRPSGSRNIHPGNVVRSALAAAAGGTTPPTPVTSADLVEGTGTRSFSAVTTQAGDYLVVGIQVEAGTSGNSYTPAATGVTFPGSANADSGTPGSTRGRAILWAGSDAAGGSRTVQITVVGTLNYRARLTVVRGSTGPSGTGAIATAQTVSLARTGDDSMVFMGVTDWSAGAVGSPAWTPGGSTTASQQGTFATYIFGRWDDSGTAGTASAGISSPSYTTPAVAALEMLGTPGAGGTVSGDSAPSFTATISPTATADFVATSSLTTTATISPIAAKTTATTAAPSFTATITPASAVTANATASQTTTATITVTATVGAAPLTAQATVTETATITVAAAATANATATRSTTATVTATGATQANASATTTATATITATATLTRATTAVPSFAATVTPVTAVTALAQATLGVTASISATATVGTAPILAQATLTETATLTATAAATANGTAARTTTATITATAASTRVAVATQTTTATITPAGNVQANGSTTRTTTAAITVAADVTGPFTVGVLTGSTASSSLTGTAAALATLTATSVTGGPA